MEMARTMMDAAIGAKLKIFISVGMDVVAPCVSQNTSARNL